MIKFYHFEETHKITNPDYQFSDYKLGFADEKHGVFIVKDKYYDKRSGRFIDFIFVFNLERFLEMNKCVLLEDIEQLRLNNITQKFSIYGYKDDVVKSKFFPCLDKKKKILLGEGYYLDYEEGFSIFFNEKHTEHNSIYDDILKCRCCRMCRYYYCSNYYIPNVDIDSKIYCGEAKYGFEKFTRIYYITEFNSIYDNISIAKDKRQINIDDLKKKLNKCTDYKYSLEEKFLPKINKNT